MPKRKNIIDVLEEYGMSPKEVGALYRDYCPFHDDTNKPNLTIWPDTNSWFCFACNIGGDVYKFVAEYEQISYEDAKRKLDGVIIDMEELDDDINSIGLDNEPVRLNNQANILLSKTIRNFLYKHPDKTKEAFEVLQYIDNRLLLSVDYKKMEILLNEVTTKLKSFV